MDKSEKKQIILRLNTSTWEQLCHLADDELRSVNGQIEYLLQVELRRRGYLPANEPPREPCDTV